LATLTIVALVLVLIVNEYFRTIFILELKKLHPSIWEELGCPSGYFSSYLFKANGFTLERYIFKQKYTKLESSLKTIGRRLYVVQYFYLFLVTTFFITVVLKLIMLLVAKG